MFEKPVSPPVPDVLPCWTPRQLVGGTLTVFAVAAAFWFLIRFYQLIFILIVAIILGVALKPAVNKLQQRGLSRPVAVLVLYAVLFVPLLAITWFSAPLLVAQTTAITTALIETYIDLHNYLLGSPSLLIRRVAAELPAQIIIAAAPPSNGEEAATTLTATWQMIQPLFRSLASIVVTFALTFYWILESERLQKTFLLFIALPHRETLRELGTAIEDKLGQYLVGQAVLCLLIGGISFVVYLMLGLPNAFLLALFAGLMEAIPNIGPVIGAIPAMIVAWSVSPGVVIAILVATGIIQLLENYLLIPRIMSRSIAMRPLVILLALLAFGSFFGVAGAIVAIPLAAVIQLGLDRFLVQPTLTEPDYPRGRDRISVLRYEAQGLVTGIRQQIRKKENVANAANDQIEDSIEAIALDLDSVLAQYGSLELSTTK